MKVVCANLGENLKQLFVTMEEWGDIQFEKLEI